MESLMASHREFGTTSHCVAVPHWFQCTHIGGAFVGCQFYEKEAQKLKQRNWSSIMEADLWWKVTTMLTLPLETSRDGQVSRLAWIRMAVILSTWRIKPPVPLFPLDEAYIVFGKPDPYAQVAWGCRVEVSTYIPALLCQLTQSEARGGATCRQQSTTQSSAFLFKGLLTVNCRDPTRIQWMVAKGVKAIPMLLYYHSALDLLSVVANSGTFRKSIVKVSFNWISKITVS